MYPTKNEVDAFIAQDSSASPIASAAIHFGLFYQEIKEIATYGKVFDATRRFYAMLRDPSNWRDVA